MHGRKHQFCVPEVDHPGLARQVRRQETLDQRCKRAKLAGFCQQGLQIALGRKNPVEFW
jgi:hypothetical protein